MEAKEGKKEWIRGRFSQRWVIDNLPFFLFLSVLTVLYIFNGHYAEKTVKDINRTVRELKELQYVYKTTNGELLQLLRQGELVKSMESRGLKLPEHPPVKLKDTLY